MKNKFLILWMLSSVLLAACDEELTPYNVDTCWLGFDMENSADTVHLFIPDLRRKRIPCGSR